MTLGWVSFLNDAASDMIYPLLPGFHHPDAGGGARRAGAHRGSRGSHGVPREGRRRVVVGQSQAAKAVRRRGLHARHARAPARRARANWGQVLAIRFSDRLGKGSADSASRRAAGRPRPLGQPRPGVRRAARDGQRRRLRRADRGGPPAEVLHPRGADRLPPRHRARASSPSPSCSSADPRAEEPSAAARDSSSSSAPPRLPRRLWIAIGIFVLFTLANSTDAFLLLRASDCGRAGLAASAPVGRSSTEPRPRFGRPRRRPRRTGSDGSRRSSLGWAIYALAYVGFAFASRPRCHVWALFGFYALFFAATEGAERALIADLAGERPARPRLRRLPRRVGLAALPASILFGLWWKLFGPRTAFLIGAAISLVATAALLLFRCETRRIGAEKPKNRPREGSPAPQDREATAKDEIRRWKKRWLRRARSPSTLDSRLLETDRMFPWVPSGD